MTKTSYVKETEPYAIKSNQKSEPWKVNPIENSKKFSEVTGSKKKKKKKKQRKYQFVFYFLFTSRPASFTNRSPWQQKMNCNAMFIVML